MKKLLATALLAACSVGSSFAAPLLGSTINYQYYFPTAGSAYSGASNGNYVVGAGVEIANVASGVATMDISANQILVDFTRSAGWNSSTFNGWVLSDALAMIDDFTSVTIDAATNMAGLTASRLSFTANSISLNWAGLSFTRNTQVVLNVKTANVPEPGTLALLGLALAGVGFVRRRRA